MANEPPPERAAAPHSNDAPAIGAVLGGRFRVLRQLGEGGMGVVLEAENTLTGKRVAIKWMRAALASKPEAVERFMREARASARVRHPNVVDVYDVVHEGDTAFLVMELLEGEPLTAVLERGGMPAHQLIALLLDAMRGVAAAHKQGVIHRDIKPDNIFLAQETDRAHHTPKVLDFGISKLSGVEALSLTQTGAAVGTPMYMSFEQLCGAKDIDARTDVYAFGVILYEALTGRPPFAAETFTELIIKITNSRPTPPRSLRADIPRSLDTLIQSAMAKERDERLPSLDVLIGELERFATAEAFRAQMTADHALLPRVVSPSEPLSQPPLLLSERADTGVDTPMSASVPHGQIPRRNDAKVWLVGGAVVASLLGALMFLASKRDASPSGQAPSSAQGPVVPSATAATLQPPAATPGVQADGLPSGTAELPSGKAPPSAAEEPAAEKQAEPVAKPKPKSKSAPPHAETRLTIRAESHPARPAIASQPPPVPAETPQPAAAAKAPAANGGTPPKLRAGKLNSLDF
jgi:serine/threonine-protein kinase